MAKQKRNNVVVKKLAVTEKKEIENVPAPSNNRGILTMANTEELGVLEVLETGASIITKYRTQEEWKEYLGKPIRCIFLGLKEIPNELGQSVICAGFQDKESLFLAGQLVLVDAVRNLKPLTPVQITYLGLKENLSSKNETNLFDIHLLK